MFRRFNHYLATLLCFVLVNSIPARAEGLRWSQVEQARFTMRGGRAGLELRLSRKEVSPHEPAVKSDRTTTPETNVIAEGGCGGTNVEVVDLCDVTGTVCEDCGEIALISEVLPEYAEIPAAAGGFPLSPFYLLALVPIAFVPFLKGDGRNATPQFTLPNPPPASGGGTFPPTGSDAPDGPSPSPVPEPATLVLFGSGLAALAAAARRRRIQLSALPNSGEVQS